MIASIAATLLLTLLAMAPGWLMARGRDLEPGMASAAMAASLSVAMLLTALIGILLNAVLGLVTPTIALGPVSLGLCFLALARYKSGSVGKVNVEWQGIALGAIFLVYGFYVEWLAVVPGESGELTVHGWYNADWFKHLGHVAALANFGIPAVDNFNQADPLHYYWLSYILPGAGTAIGNDGWSALSTANTILVFLFGSVFYGTLRKCGVSPAIALAIGTVALFVTAPFSFVYQALFGIGIEGVLNYPAAPKGPALLTLSQYIPQHLLVLILLLGWFLLKDEKRDLRMLSLAGFAPAMAISILLGAVSLLVYGLHRLWSGRLRAVPELSIMVLASCLLVVLLQVLNFGNLDSAMESPLLTNATANLPIYQRIVNSLSDVIGTAGLPFLLAILGLYFWKPDSEELGQAKIFTCSLFVASIMATIAVEFVMNERLAIENRIRVVNLLGIGNAIVGSWWFAKLWKEGAREKVIAAAVVALAIAMALPSAGIRTAWHGRIGDKFTTVISRDDLAVLKTMRTSTDRRAVLLQYPEAPLLAQERGDDVWGAILGQRAVTASLRATDFPSAVPRIEHAEKFFAGENVPIPRAVDLVYLSRARHPETYEDLLQRMGQDSDFARSTCYEDACLFVRRAISSE